MSHIVARQMGSFPNCCDSPSSASPTVKGLSWKNQEKLYGLVQVYLHLQDWFWRENAV